MPRAATGAPPGARVRCFTPYYLTREGDVRIVTRLAFSLAALIAGAVSLALAWRDLSAQSATPVLGLGFGRLAALLQAGGWPGGWLVSALEFAHFGGLAFAFAASAWFGAARKPPELPTEELIFFRRQSRWVAANPAGLAILAFMAGAFLAAIGLPLLSVVPEVFGLSLLSAAVWLLLVPEARTAMAVFLDQNMGWSNRIVLSGGLFRLGSRLTISKDDLQQANARDFGRLEMLGGARSIELVYRGMSGTQERLLLRGISQDPEVGVLASILNTKFRLALTAPALDATLRMHRAPLGLTL
ncbi:hypothetical protein [Sphingomonas sp. KR3-1]|uniref:hypothetical protein n=1 Tax=Sphingomonas sp. KR3-1 TaxID=3156611 RepID=UPI0032B6247D